VQGAPNWNGLPNEPDQDDFDLEIIGLKEALKPIPPAYGIFKGSIRIADSDIRLACSVFSADRRWVRRTEATTERIGEEGEVGQGQRTRPPSYASDGGLVV
jgi:hypothetical protein